ncbi:MAG: hypothetical protein JNM89_06570 [Hyphomicrobiaceae bacterium]|nr:hypothetical protein [Hyphomicrobiaceae bacterium]
MVKLVHIAAENQAARIRRNGIAPTRHSPDPARHPEFDRVVWTFPVLASFTLTYSWARELKRWGKTTLIAVTVDVPDDEPVYVAHYRNVPVLSSAAEAAGLVCSLADPRGYEIMVPRRIVPSEIRRLRVLPRAIGWRYYPGARGEPMRLCDCPVCLPRSEVRARRYRDAVRSRLAEGSGEK